MFSAVSRSSFSTLAFSDLVEPTMTEIRTFRTLKRSEYNFMLYNVTRHRNVISYKSLIGNQQIITHIPLKAQRKSQPNEDIIFFG